MREVCFLIAGDVVLWSDEGDSPIALADKRERWETIWKHRAELTEIAHSHPIGPLGFSHEDLTTMEALDSALGKSLRYAVVAPNGVIARVGEKEELVSPEPVWAARLRVSSGMPG